MSSQLLVRIVFLLIHITLNFIVVSYLVSFDWTGSWIRFFLFLILVLTLAALFIRHVISIIYFIKSRT